LKTALVATLNRAFGALLERLLIPLDRLAPIAGLATVSALVAVGMLFAFKATSDQKRITEVKRSIQAGLFEMRLFSDDPRTILQAQGDILRATWMYLRLSAVPLLWMILPLVLVTEHLQSHYGYQGLEMGGSALVKVLMKPGSESQARSLVLVLPSGLRVETPMIWSPATREAAWRITADRDGDYVLTVALGGARFTKTVLVSNAVGRRSPLRPEPGILNQLFYPSEPPLPADAPIGSIAVTYRQGYVPVAGWDIHWLTAFFIVSLIAAVLLKRRFRVTF
jgi:hypothetical protein